MVLLPNDEAVLIRKIADKRSAVRRKEREWRPFSTDEPLEHWQTFATELSSMSIDFEKNCESLRHKQRLKWKAEELAAFRATQDLRVQVYKSLIQFRRDELAEKLEDMQGRPATPGDFRKQMAKHEGAFKYARQVALRQSREGLQRTGPPQERPSTAPASAPRSRRYAPPPPDEIIKGRLPADDWFNPSRSGPINVSAVPPPVGMRRGVRPDVVRHIVQPPASLHRMAWV